MNREAKIKAAALALADATRDFSDEDAMRILKLARRIRKENHEHTTIQNRGN
jgi:hypothetical protein